MIRRNNRLRNLRSLCQRCHLLHDGAHHLRQRWITYRRRYALGDLLLGPYLRAMPQTAVSGQVPVTPPIPLNASTPAVAAMEDGAYTPLSANVEAHKAIGAHVGMCECVHVARAPGDLIQLWQARLLHGCTSADTRCIHFRVGWCG
jgi:hypothetical protein